MYALDLVYRLPSQCQCVFIVYVCDLDVNLCEILSNVELRSLKTDIQHWVTRHSESYAGVSRTLNSERPGACGGVLVCRWLKTFNSNIDSERLSVPRSPSEPPPLSLSLMLATFLCLCLKTHSNVMAHSHSQEDGWSQVLQEIRRPFGKAVSCQSTNGTQFLCFVAILRSQAEGLASGKPQAAHSLS